jgi:hypothetical protein
MATDPHSRDALARLLTAGLIQQAVSLVARLRIPDLVANTPLSVAELADHTGTDAPTLRRLLRVAAALEVLTSEDGDRFGLGPLGEPLRGVPGSLRAQAELLTAPPVWAAWGALAHSVATGEPAFRHANGAGLFELAGLDAEFGRVFQGWMTAQTELQIPLILDAYDFSRFSRVADLGGGRGALLSSILRTNPDLHGVLLDRPEIVSQADALDGLESRAERVGGDFFDAVPAGCDLYVLKLVLHDWDDERAVRILRGIKRAASPGARVLAVEFVVPDELGFSYATFMDLNMLVLTDGGRERTAAEHQALQSDAGLEPLGVIPTRGPISLVEAAVPA